MREFIPFGFLILTIVSFFFNILGLMQLMPLYFTLPLFFFSIYFTIFSFTHRRVYRGRMR